jgi:hypothetical protein
MKRLRFSPSGILQPVAVDGRSRRSRRFRALCEQYAAMIGGNPTAADRAEIAQVVALQLEEEQLQSESVAGALSDRDSLIRISSEARRSRQRLKARASAAKPSAPSIRDVLLAEMADEDDDSSEDEA